MSASKPLILLLPAVAVAFPLAASAQDGAAAPATKAALTAPARPATAIAPRQSLPAFALAKTVAAPLAVAPLAVAPTTPAPAATTSKGAAPTRSSLVPAAPAQTVLAPATAQTAAKTSPAQKPIAPTWSQREQPILVVPQPLTLASKTSAHRVYVAAVSAPVVASAPNAAAAPKIPASLVVTPANASANKPVAALPIQPKIEAATAAQTLVAQTPVAQTPIVQAPVSKNAPKAATPSRLASREARVRELQLSRLDAQLAGAERRLDRAQTRLTDGQKQLGSVTALLQNAIIAQGAGARGLHPFVRVAQRYLGTPYVWGGESARGFDCSGFIMRVMRDLGYKALPHSAAEQFGYGKPIAKPFLQPGDIVFFQNTYKPGVSHVGIYLGNGRFIHAANSQVGTIVSSLGEQKWIDHYAGARRLMKVG